jgi:WD40 repeat protein
LLESRDDLRLQRQLAQAAGEWQRAGEDDSYLLRGTRLAQFETWIADTSLVLTATEQRFFDTSLAARIKRQTAETARQAHEAAIEKRSRRFQRVLTAVLVMATVAALAVSAIFFSQSQTIGQERDRAETNLVTARAAEAVARAAEATAAAGALASEQAYGQVLAVQAQQALANGDGELALMLALAANEINDPPAVVQKALLDAAYAPGTRRLYQGHEGSVAAVAISGNGRTMLSASADNTVIKWDIATGEQLQQWTGHAGWVNDVVISPDALTALSASADGTIIWWDLATGGMKRQMVGYRFDAWSVAFHPNNEMALSGGSSIRFLSEDGTREQRSDDKLILWDLASDKIVRSFGGGVDGHQGDVWSVAISPDGKSALAGSDETREGVTTLILWDLESGEVLHRFESMTRAVYDVDISPDGRTGLAASADGNLTLWDLETGEQLSVMAGPEDFLAGWALAVTFSGDGRSALAGYGDGQIIWWDIETGQQIQQYLGHDDQVRDVAFLPDETGAISAGHEGVLRLWDLDNQWIVGRLGDDVWRHQASVSAIAISADGRRALSGAGQGGPDWPPGGDNSLILWDLTNDQPLKRLDGHTADVTDVTFTADGLFALSSSQDRSVILWDLERGEFVKRLTIGGRVQDAVNSVDLNPNGRWILITRNDPLGMLWDLETEQPLRSYLRHANKLADMVFGADGTLALSASYDGSLILWDVATGQALRSFVGTADLPGHVGNIVYRVAISPNGRTALSAGWDHVVILWDLASGQPLRRLLGHQGAVTGVAFLPNGETAVSSSADGSLIVWDVTTGEIRNHLASSNRIRVGLSALAINPDGQTIFTGDFNGQISQWRLEPPTMAELMAWIPANRVLRSPTCQEREVYQLLPLCESGTQATATPMSIIHVPMVEPTTAVTPLSVFTPDSTPQSQQFIAQTGENRGVFAANKRDVWTYEGLASETISIEFVPDRDEYGVNLQLFSSTSQLLSAEFNAPIESIVLPADGIYRIEVSSSLAQAEDTYTLIIVSTPP